MRNLFLGAAAGASLMCASVVAGGAQAEPQGQFIIAVDRGDAQPLLQDAQFLFGGRNYCWYPAGWRGPGFYWCGYAQRQGLGWGGGSGWNGWQGGGRGGSAGGSAGGARAGHATNVRSGGARMSAGRTTAARGGGHAGAVRTASRGGGGGHAGGGGGGRKPGK